MTTFAFPSTIIPTNQVFDYDGNTDAFTSPFNKAVQTVGRGGDAFTMRMTFHGLQGVKRRVMQAFIMSLRGRANRFTCPDHSYTRRGVAGGVPLVNGAGQGGNTLVVDGCTPSIVGYLLAADQFQINNELKFLTADATTNGAGQTTLTFGPTLRVSPADNAPIILTAPQGLWMLASSKAGWSTDPGDLSEVVLEAFEDALG